jgi:hypothetical protein
MLRIAFSILAWVSLFASVSSHADAQLTIDLTTEPDEATFVYEDVWNFASALQRLAAGGDTVAILQAEYFDRATAGLQYYLDNNGITAERLAGAIARRPQEFAALIDLPERLAAQADTFRQALTDVKRIIPNAVFAPTTFLIGPWFGASEASEQGVLISVEKPYTAEHKTHTLAHEHIHIQQALAQGIEQYQSLYDDGPNRTLLALAIREGSADFLAKLAVGGTTHEGALEYCMAHESELWERFSSEMAGREPGHWMWAEPMNPAEPRDLGYAMGFMIVRAYYERAEDKAEAVRAILAVTDYPAFLEQSGYAERFAR